MQMIRAGLTAIAVCVSVMSVAAQGRNFSGTWVLDMEKTRAAAVASGVGGGGGGGGRGGVVGGITNAPVGGGAAVASGGGGGMGGGRGGGGGMVGAGGTSNAAVASRDTIITLDATTFTIEAAGQKTSYPLNGADVDIVVRGTSGRARAQWHGDALVVTTTLNTPNGPVTSTTTWSLEGDALVRETTSKTYYMRK